MSAQQGRRRSSPLVHLRSQADARCDSNSGVKFIDTRGYARFKEIDRQRTLGGYPGYV
jgi:hypothetical protein